jgi:hypothetical protein
MRQPDPLSIDPHAVARAADGALDASRELAQTARPLLSTLDIEDGWLSGLPAAARLTDAHEATLADGQELVESIGAALEGDADRLYQVAFAMSASDSSAAHRLRGHR